MAKTKFSSRNRKGPYRLRKPLESVCSAFQAFLEEVNSPRSLTVSLLISNNEWDQLVSLDINPNHYHNPRAFRDDYQCTKFLAKCQDLPTSFNRTEKALEKWAEAEASCLETNNRLRGLREMEFSNSIAIEILHLARLKIASTLGLFSPDEWLSACAWGPGATSSTNGSDTSSERKFRSRADITPKACCYAIFAKREFPSWDYNDLHLRNYNKLLFVPKTAKVDRAICVEPHMNSFFQKGLGTMIRRRLSRDFIDLDRGQSFHRELAQEASASGELATIDLSSASDTISLQLVFDLLPDDWFSLLDDFRSPFTMKPDGSLHENQKFSSMGNGYTFELETLIFHAILFALAKFFRLKSEIFVYGDDIICSPELADKFIEWIPFFGFSVNKEKTFLSGPFRESCGSDCFLGHDVRPFFLKELPHDEESLYRLVNGIRTAASRFHFDCSSSHSRISFDRNGASRIGMAFGHPARSLTPRLLVDRFNGVPTCRKFDFSAGVILSLIENRPDLEKLCDKVFKSWYDSSLRLLPKGLRSLVPYGFNSDQGILASRQELPGYDGIKISFIKRSTPKRKVHPSSSSALTFALYSAGGEPTNQMVSLRNGGTYRRKEKVVSHLRYYFGDWV